MHIKYRGIKFCAPATLFDVFIGAYGDIHWVFFLTVTILIRLIQIAFHARRIVIVGSDGWALSYSYLFANNYQLSISLLSE